MSELERVQAELDRVSAVLWQREQLLDNTEQGIWHLDNDGLTVYVNPAMCRLLGRQRQDILGQSVFNFFSGPDLDILKAQLERRKRGHKQGYEIGLLQPDGSRVECFNNATPVYDAAGVKLGSVGMWTDLTPIKQAQRELDVALADSTARRVEYEALLASFPGIIAVLDQDARYLFVNQELADLMGLSVDAIVGRLAHDIRGPERAAQLISEFPRLRAGEVISDVTEHRSSDGRSVTLRVHRLAGPPRADGQRYYSFGFDVSDIFKGQARSNFLNHMSHEIRTPMNAIIGLTEVTLGTELTPQQQDYLGKVKFAGHALMDLLDDVLDLSKIEAGKLQMETIPFNLAEVLQGTAATLTDLVKNKGLSWHLSCVPEVPRQLLGDPKRLRQVLTNLISNARKFTETGGIVLDVALVSGPPEPVVLRFAVRDTGVGMTPAQLEAVFQPFVQADASISRKFGGTGLGLSICRELVALMGGRIWAHSEPGQGSTFSVELPFMPLATGAGTEAAAADPLSFESPGFDANALASLRGARILLVEDNAVNQLVAVALLKRVDCVVEVAEHGQEALAWLSQGQFDCVLMDLHMPVMDGCEATAHIRANPDWASLPVLAMSASVLSEDRARARQAGVNGHIAKPVLPQELFAALLHWIPLSRRRAGETNG